MRRTVPLILLLVAFMVFIPSAAATDREENVTTITEDGFIQTNPWNRDNTANQVIAGFAVARIYRGYVEWDISALPNNTINQVLFYYDGLVYSHDCNLTLLTNRPSTTNNKTLYWEIGLGNSTIIASEAGFPVVGDQQVITINAAGITGLQNALTAGQAWFAVGLRNVNETGPGDSRSYFTSEDAAGVNPLPTLYVEFFGNFTYVFDGGYYENGTVYGGVDVSYSTPTDSGEFTVNGPITKHFAVEPDVFYWDVGGGAARSLFSYGSENFTVTLPESTDAIYSFTIKDYIGKIGEGDAYLEAYRVINGTETLIERNKIYSGNPVPINLVVGKSYHIKILWSDGTRYDWGYFVAAGETSINIVIRGTTFTDQAHFVNNYITVEATRSGGQFTVNYEDDRNRTTWANLTIRVRNGAIAYTESNSAASKVFTWNGGSASTGYIVTVTGDHLDCGEWGYSKTFDPSDTWPAAPSLTGIISIGGIDGTYLISFTIWLVTLITFSYQWREIGMLAAMGVGTVLSTVGWANWGYNLLALGWVFSILAATLRRKT